MTWWPGLWDDSPEACQARRDALPGVSTSRARPKPTPPTRRPPLVRADAIEDVAFMLDHGELPDRIFERVGSTRKQLMKMLHVWGRSDLAALLTVEASSHGWADAR